MNKTIATMILLAVAGFASAATSDDAKTAGAPNAASRTVSLPKAATKNPDGTYSWTDEEGGKWTYKKTDAGFVRTTAGQAIPKDAVSGPNGSFVWTDKAGNKWQYWNTPFGVLKQAWTGNNIDPASKAAQDTSVKVIDQGDSVRFERPSPFGPVFAYEKKKKSELTDDERRLYEASQPKPE